MTQKRHFLQGGKKRSHKIEKSEAASWIIAFDMLSWSINKSLTLPCFLRRVYSKDEENKRHINKTKINIRKTGQKAKSERVSREFALHLSPIKFF